MSFSLVAFDTNHITEYVFGTDTLKEIRGASSLLDRLNRNVMPKVAKSYSGVEIYANGGSGLFLIDSTKADEFATRVQHEYRQMTAGGASVTYAVQHLPIDAPRDIESIMAYSMLNTLDLLRYRLREKKDHPCVSIEPKDQRHSFINAVSHPLMRPCDSCGVYYAVKQASDVAEFYCQVCWNKQEEDGKVKRYIERWIRYKEQEDFKSPLWEKMFDYLRHYSLPENTERPEDLNVFSKFPQAKDYLGLIYADGNGMGRAIKNLATLNEVKVFAENVDKAVYDAMCEVIGERLPVQQLGEKTWIFPFDVLLIGGDDIVLVTSAAEAVPVAHALAKRFHALANKDRKSDKKECKSDEEESLSVAVVLAPTNYPFSLIRNLADEALKFAKKDGSKTFAKKKSDYGKTRINFLVVAGSTSQSFQKAYNHLHKKYKDAHRSFYATMRPYTLEQLEFLLAMLQEGRQLSLGRTKLHQLREAILHRDLSTSVTESLAVLRTWRENERDFVVKKVYSTGRGYSLLQWDEQNPADLFPAVTFPWFVENKENGAKHYSTLLLDFVELYDFVAREGGDEQ